MHFLVWGYFKCTFRSHYFFSVGNWLSLCLEWIYFKTQNAFPDHRPAVRVWPHRPPPGRAAPEGFRHLPLHRDICETIVWKSFSPATVKTCWGTKFDGAVVTPVPPARHPPGQGPRPQAEGAFYRQNLPNLMNLSATVFIFGVVIYFRGFVLTCRSSLSCTAACTEATTSSRSTTTTSRPSCRALMVETRFENCAT